ncbi:MAG: repressor LexA [Dehalococcoidia bacterium]|nr:repressor LexA [Dehalococcoidia bacterium]
MTTKSLSSKQELIINFVAQFLRDKGYPPTIRDIATGCRLSSTSVVAYNLKKLQQAGYIRRHSDISRGIEFLGPSSKSGKLVHIPMVGVIAAGQPIPVPETGKGIPDEGVDVSEELVRGRQAVYALRVRGDSMQDALIGDGDIVLMDRAGRAENGDMVAAWLKAEQEVTLKRFFAEPERVRLQPANSLMEPIYTSPDNVEVQGRVVAVIRRIS